MGLPQDDRIVDAAIVEHEAEEQIEGQDAGDGSLDESGSIGSS
jgi:hypothetical protein